MAVDTVKQTAPSPNTRPIGDGTTFTPPRHVPTAARIVATMSRNRRNTGVKDSLNAPAPPVFRFGGAAHFSALSLQVREETDVCSGKMGVTA